MRRKFIARVTDQDGVAQSAAAVFVLRSGAPLASGGATSVPANSTAVVRVLHPGALKVNDEVYWLASYNGNVTGNFRITAISAYNASGYWNITLLDLSGSTTAIGTSGDLVLKWNDTDHWVQLYTNDSGASGIVGVATISSTTGELVFYADVPQVDLAITNAGVLQRYVRDLTTESKTYILPEEFGAVGDGSTDDTTAIQNALDWASEVEGGATVLFQKPSYLCTSATASSANVRIVGYGIPVNITGGKPRIMFGSDNPEGNVTCPIGSIYQKTSGTSDDALYIKETGTGNTGWKAFKTTYLPLAGGTMSGDIDLNGNAIKILGSVVIENSIGDPNGVITGNPGSVYVNRSGGSSVTLWVKESGVLSTTGWIALASTSGFTMTGDINMGGNDITNVGTIAAFTATGNIDMNGNDLDLSAGQLLGNGYVDANNSASPTSYTALATHTIAQNRMGANQAIRVKAFGQWTGTNGVKDGRLVLGSTTLIALTQSTAPQEYKWEVEAMIVFESTSAQHFFARAELNNQFDSENDYGTASENIGTGSLALKFEAQLGSASDTAVLGGFVVEYIGGA